MERIYLCKTLWAAECHIFEPNPPAVQVCEANIARHGRGCSISFSPVALSDKVGSASFFPVNLDKSDNKDMGFSSMLPINPVYASKRRGSIVQDQIMVPVTTLDSYFEGREKQPDPIWIDVEGAERLVMSGGEKVLRHVTLIHVEISFRPMQTGKPIFWEIDKFLGDRCFRLFEFVGVSRAKAFW